MTWAAGAVLTGLLAAGMPSTAAAAGSPPSPTPDAIAQSADAISKCLTDHGYPPLPSASVLAPAPAGPSGSPPAITVPAAGTITLPTAGTIPAAADTASGGGAVPAAAAAAAAALDCGKVIINNNVYFVTVTTTTTTTNVDAPVNAGTGSISTTSDPAAPSPAAAPPLSAVGRPLRAHGGARAGHKRAARGRRPVRVRRSSRPGHAKRVARVRLIRMGHATRR